MPRPQLPVCFGFTIVNGANTFCSAVDIGGNPISTVSNFLEEKIFSISYFLNNIQFSQRNASTSISGIAPGKQ